MEAILPCWLRALRIIFFNFLHSRKLALTKKFMIFVIDDLSGSGTPEEMVAINAFNAKLRAQGHWILAEGLSPAAQGNVMDNRGGAQRCTGKPLFDSKENYSGFWLVQAEGLEHAQQLALEGSRACNRRVELLG
jgi:hypothetical protein